MTGLLLGFLAGVGLQTRKQGNAQGERGSRQVSMVAKLTRCTPGRSLADGCSDTDTSCGSLSWREEEVESVSLLSGAHCHETGERLPVLMNRKRAWIE